MSFHGFLCTALQFSIFCCCNLQFVEFLQAVQVEGALSCAVCFTAMQHVGGGREGHEC